MRAHDYITASVSEQQESDDDLSTLEEHDYNAEEARLSEGSTFRMSFTVLDKVYTRRLLLTNKNLWM